MLQRHVIQSVQNIITLHTRPLSSPDIARMSCSFKLTSSNINLVPVTALLCTMVDNGIVPMTINVLTYFLWSAAKCGSHLFYSYVTHILHLFDCLLQVNLDWFYLSGTGSSG